MAGDELSIGFSYGSASRAGRGPPSGKDLTETIIPPIAADTHLYGDAHRDDYFRSGEDFGVARQASPVLAGADASAGHAGGRRCILRRTGRDHRDRCRAGRESIARRELAVVWAEFDHQL